MTDTPTAASGAAPASPPTADDRHERFAALHRSGTFVLVNAHHAGEARAAARAGAVAVGTTSSGHADSLGRPDAVGAVSREEAVARVAEICDAVDVPVSVDAENGWAATPVEVARTITLLAEAGASGASIEDWSSDRRRGFYELPEALDRLMAAIEAARSLSRPFVVCARAEACLYPGHLHGADPFDTALARVQAFASAGADCVYAPGIGDLDQLSRLVSEAGAPVNALVPIGSRWSVSELAGRGVRRISLGGSLYRAAMGYVEATVRELLTSGRFA